MIYAVDYVERCGWGPFENEDEAELFIASDKYLQNACLVVDSDHNKTTSLQSFSLYEPMVYWGDDRWKETSHEIS